MLSECSWFRITAGQKDYAGRMKQMEASRNEHYASLGIPPGPPTSKGIWSEPEVSGTAHVNKPLGNYDIPDNWPRPPIKNPPGDVPGPPLCPEAIPRSHKALAVEKRRDTVSPTASLAPPLKLLRTRKVTEGSMAPLVDPNKVETGYSFSQPLPTREDDIYFYHSDHQTCLQQQKQKQETKPETKNTVVP